MSFAKVDAKGPAPEGVSGKVVKTYPAPAGGKYTLQPPDVLRRVNTAISPAGS